MSAATWTGSDDVLEIRECSDEGLGANMADPEGTYTGGVDDPATAGQRDGGRGCGGVASLAGHVADRSSGSSGSGN